MNAITTTMTADEVDDAIDAQLAEQGGDESNAGIEVDHTNLDLARHDGTITMTNPATGQHRTLRVRTIGQDAKAEYMRGKRVIELLIGPDNTSDYQGFGFVGTPQDSEPGRIRVWKRYEGTAACRSQYERLAGMLEDPAYWASRGVKYLASLRCRRCGRKLTHPESVLSGLGPVCAGRE